MKESWSKMTSYEIHLELTSSCQASCPACSRIFDYNENIPNGKDHSSWSLEELNKVFNFDVLQNVREFLLCGNYGDPMAFPQIDQWVENVLSIKKSVGFWVHTNGGIGSPETWKNLGKLFKNSGSRINFSLDGLSDTNHIYRRGVRWDLAIKNAQTYIEAGGPAIWKFIKFDHNKHQVDEARSLANEMGFKKFKVINPYSNQSNFSQEPSANELPKDSQKSYLHLSKDELEESLFKPLKTLEKSISCHAIDEQSLYIDCDKRLWPCCWMARTADHRLRLKQREEFYRKVYDEFGLDETFNSLKMKDINSLINSAFFREYLPQSWTEKSIKQNKCLSICLEKCSKADVTPV